MTSKYEKEAIKDELLECVDNLITNYGLDIELSDTENKINSLVDALCCEEDEDEWENDEDDIVEYRNDMDDFLDDND